MTERPILFSAPMVRAILDGEKLQTRRLVKGFALECLQPDGFTPAFVAMPENRNCPFGYAGDRLWVRETWSEVGTMDPGLIVYRADYPACVPKHYENLPPDDQITWKPSIHMFRKHSRISLEVTGVRIERLQDISERDAWAEGCLGSDDDVTGGKSGYAEYCELWEAINGAGSWEANPWVWVVEFKRVAP